MHGVDEALFAEPSRGRAATQRGQERRAGHGHEARDRAADRVEKGADALMIMEVLGHSSIRVTMDLYTFVRLALSTRPRPASATPCATSAATTPMTARAAPPYPLDRAARRLMSELMSPHTQEAPSDDRKGPLSWCALGRIRTCNLLIRSQVLYPLSYERLASRRFFCRSALRGQHYMTSAARRNPFPTPPLTCESSVFRGCRSGRRETSVSGSSRREAFEE